mmetsp:Transcript_16434/g.45848  ORF Transcript_16434/g.45848 Transcript_16434/m.45848 type:complete len:200 (-) Transcript_16434:1210-1809(-)
MTGDAIATDPSAWMSPSVPSMHFQSICSSWADKTRISRLCVPPLMPCAADLELLVPWTIVCHFADLGKSIVHLMFPRFGPAVSRPQTRWDDCDKSTAILTKPKAWSFLLDWVSLAETAVVKSVNCDDKRDENESRFNSAASSPTRSSLPMWLPSSMMAVEIVDNPSSLVHAMPDLALLPSTSRRNAVAVPDSVESSMVS